MAECYLKALALIFEKTGTAMSTVPEPRLAVLFGGPDDVVQREELKQQQELDDAREHNRLVEIGKKLMIRMAIIFPDSDVDQKKLLTLAESVLTNKSYLDCVIDHVATARRQPEGVSQTIIETLQAQKASNTLDPF